MPKRAYLEDVIERIVQLARFQLQHSIYPAYDPVYRTESKKDSISLGIGYLNTDPSEMLLLYISVYRRKFEEEKGQCPRSAQQNGSPGLS